MTAKMSYIKYTILTLAALLIFGFAHYTLRSQDVVRVVGTEVVRTEVGQNPMFWVRGSATASSNRDIRFINAVLQNGKPMVYRNEDTAWGWPPYFKFNSGDLQAEAQQFSEMSEGWILINHYGIRSRIFSIYPNITNLRVIESPSVAPINWVRIIGFVLIGFILLAIWRLWNHFTLWLQEKADSLKSRLKR